MNPEANKAIVRRYLEAWGRGDTKTLEQMLHPEAITHVSATNVEQSMTFEPYACATWFAGFPDTVLEIEKLVAEGDSVSAYWVITATHTAEFMGMPATGKQVKFGGLEINRVADSKIVEIWRLSDTSGLMAQLEAEG